MFGDCFPCLAATSIGSNVRGSVHTLADKSMALWDKVRKRLGNSENSAGCSCGREYPNSESVFYEDYFTRFSLLLLEPGEIYFEDFSVFHYPSQLSEEEAIKRKQRGRLKICSKSILFDPIDTSYPILKFPLRECIAITHWSGSLMSRIDTKGDVLAIESKQVIEMKEGNTIAPYTFRREKAKYLFSFNFVALNFVLPQLEQLHRATTLMPADQQAMINSIVQSRQARVSFNTSWLEDLHEKIVMETMAKRITPLVCNPGRIMLTSSRLYFQPFNNADPCPVVKCKLSKICRVVKRRYLLRHVGVEVFSADGSHMYLIFNSPTERDLFFEKIVQQPEVELEDTRQENMTLRWQNGAISNFEYLMYLNSLADRSFNDLTQYPVFPWVISDYKSVELDFENGETFRDLSKPIGALNETRLAQLKERCKEMPDPKFLYGSHYSTPGYVLYYLVRVAPEFMLCLQGGKFDQPDRLFNSIAETWENVLTGHADVKELIPEFFQSSGEFLLNSQSLPLGCKQDKTKVMDVELPAWAKDPGDFIRKNREALECPYVSERLHNWIDLIFGYKQRGHDAWQADNVFYYLTYEGAVDLEKIEDPNERASLEAQILEFGQTPKQLFTSPHPQKLVTGVSPSPSTDPTPISSSILNGENPSEPAAKSPATLPVIKVNVDFDEMFSNNHSQWTNMEKLQQATCHKLHKEESSSCSVNVNITNSQLTQHRSTVTSVRLSKDCKNVFSVSQDTQLKMYSLETKQQVRGINLSSMALSSCAIMPDSKTIIVGSWDNKIYIYSVEYGRVVDTKAGHDDAISCLCWNDGILVTASWDSTVKVWKFFPEPDGKKPSPPEILAELEHDTEVNSVDLDPTNTLVVTGTMDGTVMLWNIDQQAAISHHPIHKETVHSVLFSPDGQRILSCGADHFMRVVDVHTGTEVYSKDVGEEIRCAVWDGQMVLAGGESGYLQIWDLINVQEVSRITAHEGAIRCIDVSSDGCTVVTGGEDGQVIMWKLHV
ncbi:protein FAN-like isoform X2 [Stylophora pistillata]|uniref:Protein FAN n=1 Tax=Stylophora pistillata TaxID=50429 RepID=A0A2B4S5B0_STYPI|nr:protein FAN-like isoform X2 [Stylophora pistillata]PFX23712.1 Protein FAN [Stylophora pistillata]